MEEKFDQLFKEVCQAQEETHQFWREVEEKFDASIAKVKREANAAQQKTTDDVARKISSTNYQFKKKGHEHQYRFNWGVEEAISSAQADLTKIKPLNPSERTALKEAQAKFDKGRKALATRQKHIKIADRSDNGWNTVSHYQEDHLASNTEDEKEIEWAENRAEKEAKKEAEKQEKMGYKRRGGGGGRKRRRFQPYTQWGDNQGLNQNGYYDRREPPPAPMPQRPFRPKVLGPVLDVVAMGI